MSSSGGTGVHTVGGASIPKSEALDIFRFGRGKDKEKSVYYH